MLGSILGSPPLGETTIYRTTTGVIVGKKGTCYVGMVRV